MPEILIPAWVREYPKDALIPGRLTPARCRFVAAAALHMGNANSGQAVCKAKTPTVRCRGFFARKFSGFRRSARRFGDVCDRAAVRGGITCRELAETSQNPRHDNDWLTVPFGTADSSEAARKQAASE